jgi:threonine dehydrogenase-like Zn-dependent dehydrogenase
MRSFMDAAPDYSDTSDRRTSVMKTMKAALFDPRTGMRTTTLPVQQAEPGTVIVRIRASGICGSDLGRYRMSDWTEKLPSGHEVAGEVVEVGEGVANVSVGDRVAIEAVSQGRACGKCRFCQSGQFRRCIDIGDPWKWSQEGWGGGFAEYIKRRGVACYKLPVEMTWEEGALVEPLAVGVHGVRRARMLGGETVVVLGAGTIGLTAVAAARSLGAGKVFVTARYDHQADMATRLGADAAFQPDSPDLIEALDEATEGVGADVVIETVGGHDFSTIKQAFQLGRGQARIVVLGIFHDDAEINFLVPFRKEQAVIFAQCYSYIDETHDFTIARDIVTSRRLPLKEIVTHTFPLDKAAEAIETAMDKNTGCIKVQFTP